ncbi:MAG: methylmalonyl-CoA mutase [Chloroflexota bacterium]|nr:MAG: methylmalonyl-CoA mutase [Chloroflexota bacterium]
MTSARRIRVLLTKVGLDGHDLGVKVLSRALRDAGMEVVYLGRFQTPENIVQAALQESVDVIGLSILSGEQLIYIPEVIELVGKHGLDDVLVLVGGVFPKADIPVLKEMGVSEVFMGSLTAPVVEYINQNVGKELP